MTRIGKKPFARRLTGGGLRSIARGALYTAVAVGLMSTAVSAQGTRADWKRIAQVRPDAKKHLRAVQPAAPEPPTAALPIADPASRGGALVSALASCDNISERREPLTLPGAKSEIKLDGCYRGREQLACSLNVLLNEAKDLLGNYTNIVESHYPDIGDVNAVCSIKSDSLAADLEKANDFKTRFNVLKAEYSTRANCATRVEQSLSSVSLPDLEHAPDILKSMIDAIESDLKNVAATQQRVVDLGDRIVSSEKAMITIQKIHRAMCLSGQVQSAQPATGGVEMTGARR